MTLYVCSPLPGEVIPRVYSVLHPGIYTQLQLKKAGRYNSKIDMVQINHDGLELIKSFGVTPILCKDVEVLEPSKTGEKAKYFRDGTFQVVCRIRVRRTDGSFSMDWWEENRPEKIVKFVLSFNYLDYYWQKYCDTLMQITLKQMLSYIGTAAAQQVEQEAIEHFNAGRKECSFPSRSALDWHAGKEALKEYMNSHEFDEEKVWEHLFRKE